MALSLGTLFVKLNADPSQLSKGLTEAGAKVAQFGQKMGELGSKLGGLGLAMSAIGATALRTAAQFDGQVKAATDELGNAFKVVSVEIGRALIPVVQALSQAMTILANWLQSLSPETKAFAATLAGVAAAGLGTFGMVSKLVAVVSALGPVFTGALAPVLPVLLPIAAVIAAIVAIVPLLWAAWKHNFGNIQGFTGAVVDWVTEKWKSFKDYFGGAISFIGNAWNKLVDFLWQTWAKIMKKIAEWAGKVAKAFGADWAYELEAFNETIDDIAGRGFTGLVDDAVEGAKIMAFAWKEGASDIAKNIKDLIGGAIKGVTDQFGKALPKLPEPAKPMPEAKAAEQAKPQKEAVAASIKISDTMNAATTSFSAGMRNATDIITQNLGELSGILSAAQQGLAAGGPWGALAAVAASLLTRSAQFTAFIEQLNGFIGELANMFGAIFGPIMMQLAVQMKAFMPVLKLLSQILGGPLFLAFKAFGIIVLSISWVLGQVINGVVSVIAWAMNTIGDALNVIGAGQGVKDAANNLRQNMVDTAAIERGMADIINMRMETAAATLEPVGTGMVDVASSATGAADAMNNLTDSLLNAPAGFKVAAARFNATIASSSSAIMGGEPLMVNLIMDGRQIHTEMVRLNRREYYIANGGLRPSNSWS